jgi:hypothetical protein
MGWGMCARLKMHGTSLGHGSSHRWILQQKEKYSQSPTSILKHIGASHSTVERRASVTEQPQGCRHFAFLTDRFLSAMSYELTSFLHSRESELLTYVHRVLDVKPAETLRLIYHCHCYGDSIEALFRTTSTAMRSRVRRALPNYDRSTLFPVVDTRLFQFLVLVPSSMLRKS